MDCKSCFYRVQRQEAIMFHDRRSRTHLPSGLQEQAPCPLHPKCSSIHCSRLKHISSIPNHSTSRQASPHRLPRPSRLHIPRYPLRTSASTSRLLATLHRLRINDSPAARPSMRTSTKHRKRRLSLPKHLDILSPI